MSICEHLLIKSGIAGFKHSGPYITKAWLQRPADRQDSGHRGLPVAQGNTQNLSVITERTYVRTVHMYGA